MSATTSAERPSLFNVLLIVAAASVGSFVYTWADRPTPTAVDLFILGAPTLATGMWLLKYLRRLRFAIPFDFGYLLFIGWPVLILVIARRLPVANPKRFALMLYTFIVSPFIASLFAVIGSAFARR